MATRDDVYRNFGLAAEAAQLFETEILNIFYGASILENDLHKRPDPDRAQAVFQKLDKKTLGALLNKKLKRYLDHVDEMKRIFTSALEVRNRLTHTFFRDHNFAIQNDEGRDVMVAELDALHSELFSAWQLASDVSERIFKLIHDDRAKSAH